MAPFGDDPLQHLKGRVPIKPMERAAERHHVEDLAGREVLNAAGMQNKTHTCHFRCCSCRLDHGGFRVEPRATSYERSEADHQRTWATADVEQGFITLQGKPFGNSLEESRRVGLSAAGIELDS